MVLERRYQPHVIQEIKKRFPGAFILKNDTAYMQGVPDLTILLEDRWAVLETKRSGVAKRQPNQEYYIDVLDSMSFAAFLCPENEEEILNELTQTFQPGRTARVSKR